MIESSYFLFPLALLCPEKTVPAFNKGTEVLVHLPKSFRVWERLFLKRFRSRNRPNNRPAPSSLYKLPHTVHTVQVDTCTRTCIFFLSSPPTPTPTSFSFPMPSLACFCEVINDPTYSTDFRVSCSAFSVSGLYIMLWGREWGGGEAE